MTAPLRRPTSSPGVDGDREPFGTGVRRASAGSPAHQGTILLGRSGHHSGQHADRRGRAGRPRGHLLCRGVLRHASGFNPDGSNITCPDDMVTVMRHIYDDAFSGLTLGERSLCRQVMEKIRASYLAAGPIDAGRIREKRGYIRDPETGDDIHAVGIVDARLIVCIMLNKVGLSETGGEPAAAFRRIMTVLAPCLDPGPASPETDCAG